MQTLIQSCDVFTHNTQYSLLILIHVHVQCDLVVTRFTHVNVCPLNYLNLFLKYKIDQTCLVCVCVFWDQNAYHFFDERCFERSKCCLDPWLSCMFNCIHVCVFLFIEKLFLKQSQQLLDTSQQLAHLLSSLVVFYRNFDTSRQLGGSIEKVSIPSIAPQQLLDPSSLFCCGHLWTPS